MALERKDVVDAVGIERATGAVVLTLLDSWEWTDEQAHVLALHNKLSAYLAFIESGEILTAYPVSIGKSLVIEIIGRFAIPEKGRNLINDVQPIANRLKVELRFKHIPEATGRG